VVTKIRTAKSNKSQTHQYFTQEVRSLTPFSDVSGLHQNRPENDTRSGPTSVADMDNLVYLYMSEMGQTPKINAAKEKELSSRIEQGRFLSRLEGELKVKLEDTPLPSEYYVGVAGAVPESPCRY
jgi:hypothetical protein